MGEYAEIKDRIKQLRLSRGWSQQELADKLGVTNVAVSQWERGVKQPKMEMREALCDLFNVNMEYLNGNWDKISRLLSENEAQMLDRKKRLITSILRLQKLHSRSMIIRTFLRYLMRQRTQIQMICRWPRRCLKNSRKQINEDFPWMI